MKDNISIYLNRRSVVAGCECTRMIKITETYQGYRQLPCLFIRYNPDEYKSEYSDEDNDGIVRKRHETLKKLIEEYMKVESLPMFTGMIQLFYDGYEPRNIEVLTLR